jgi:hypothetical protein
MSAIPETKLTDRQISEAARVMDEAWGEMANRELLEEIRAELSAARKAARAVLVAGLHQRGGYFRDARGEGWLLSDDGDGFWRESYVASRAHRTSRAARAWYAGWRAMNERRFGEEARGPAAAVAVAS